MAEPVEKSGKTDKVEVDPSAGLQDSTRVAFDAEPGKIKVGNFNDKTGGSPFHALIHARQLGLIDVGTQDEALSAAAKSIKQQDLKANPRLKKDGYKAKDEIRIPDELASDQLKAERAAWKEFPQSENKKFRDLSTKEKLGLITEEELSELNKKRFDCAEKSPPMPDGDLSKAYERLGKLPALCESSVKRLPEEQYNAVVGKAVLDILLKEPDNAETVQGRDVSKYSNQGNTVVVKSADGSPLDLSHAKNEEIAERLKHDLAILNSPDYVGNRPEYKENYQQEFQQLLDDKYQGLKDNLKQKGKELSERLESHLEELKSQGLNQKEAEWVLTGGGLSDAEAKAFVERLKAGPKERMTTLGEMRTAFQKERSAYSELKESLLREVALTMSAQGKFPPGKQFACCCVDGRQKGLAMIARIETGLAPDGAACHGHNLDKLGFLQEHEIKQVPKVTGRRN